ncbi:unnamed protein product [Blumeria hordei]|uniref:Uncharacterized protein n=1 Tax=Blumeria hordei TaxID=2867405 RepID=A0A383UNA8_BLUHO|nr:unnamed protein product [Blumeria hordei]
MHESWFPRGRAAEGGWRLDIVSLLAVIGESSMDSHIQVLTSSWYCILPRLLPAPQALLKPTRRTRMPQVNAAVVGVHNGTFVPTLNYFPEILHPIDDLPAFAFKVLKITHRHQYGMAENDLLEAGEQDKTEFPPVTTLGTDLSVEEGGIKPPTKRSTLQSIKRRVTKTDNRPRIPARKCSPLSIITFISFIWTCVLLIWAIIIEDGTAILALITISMVSSVVGMASWWQPVLMNRPSKAKVPAGDVVIRTREGAFLLVQCNEDVARELYTGTEECQYHIKTKGYRILVGVGTVLLMVSVVLMGNCGFIMQAAIGLSYMVLNGVYWAASLIDRTRFWNLSNFHVEDVTPEDGRDAHKQTPDHMGEMGQKPSFTRTMWYAIRETQKIGWVKRGGAAPKTSEWDEWLLLAEKNAVNGNRKWPAVQMRDNLVGHGSVAYFSSSGDGVQERAPAYEVPPEISR